MKIIGGLMLKDMPHLDSPFLRKTFNNGYYLIPEINPVYRWVFEEESLAVDKIDGTNVSVLIKDGRISRVFNRTQFIEPWTENSLVFNEGIVSALSNENIVPGYMPDGQYFGELIGPNIRGNAYKLEKHLWVPFFHLKEKYYYKFWNDFRLSLIGKSDVEIYEEMSKLFQALWSIYKRNRNIPGDIKSINADTKFEGLAAEGIVFYRENGDMCKLRRDMFDWYKGKQHGELA